MLDKNLKELKCNLNTEDNIHSYNIKKSDFNSTEDYIAEGIRIWFKCYWCEHSKKLQSYFLISKISKRFERFCNEIKEHLSMQCKKQIRKTN